MDTAPSPAAPVYTRDQLEARIAALARVPLAHLPTPLDPCPRLSEALGGPDIHIKRDDLTGLAFGGNKTRQLEFLFADVLARGADIVVAGAYSQSNWCRQITAAARKLGLEAALVLLHGVKGPRRQGNLLLMRLLGAEVAVVDLDDMQLLEPLLQAKADELAAAGRTPYVIAPFDLDQLALSTVGYVNAAVELDAQLEDAGLTPDYLYTAGANMTPAGLALGLAALGRATRVINISPITWDVDRATDIARIASAAARLLDLGIELRPADVTVDEGYIGEGYGIVSRESRAARKLVAESEGIFLDRGYSSKAMAGLIDHVRTGRVAKGESVVFLHTGGTPALFAYADDLEPG
jgi:1-aminocyclopropane-1-carboxylate deaminase/D-cysteine desulfhydrase-like pyridoxal-dependent ACC family enzyme